MVHGGSIPVYNQYFCGAILQKQPEESIFTKNSFNSKLEAPFVFPQLSVEVAFTHESLCTLFLELVHYLSEYVPNLSYAIGLWVKSRKQSAFQAFLIVLKRLLPSDVNKCNLIIENYASSIKYLPDSYHKGFIEGTDIVCTKDFIEKNFNVNLISKADINDDFIDSGSSITINFDGAEFGLPSNVEVVISNEVLNQVRRCFTG